MGLFSMEYVVAQNPDVILIARHAPADGSSVLSPAEALAGNPAWAGIKAVIEKRVYLISEWDYVSSPGPTVIDAITHLREILYPEATLGSH